MHRHVLSLRRALMVATSLAFIPMTVQAAGLAPRQIQMSTSQPGVTAQYTVLATTATSASIGSVRFEMCTTATSTCTPPPGLVSTGASLVSQSGATGFTMVNSVNGSPYITRGSAPLPASTALSFGLAGITNPTAANQTFYVRITTYTGTDGATGAVDTGTVAASTAQHVLLTGVTPEILVFCVGTAIPGTCSTVTGNSIDFGDFSPTGTSSGTSVMQAQTNAGGGYAITVNGTTLASGINTIPALATQTASAAGQSQFGLNVRANTAPAVGAELTGAGSATYAANYATANQYRFGSGDVVAQAAGPTNANTFTSSYVVNIEGAQAAGVYTATMTYVCTASF